MDAQHGVVVSVDFPHVRQRLDYPTDPAFERTAAAEHLQTHQLRLGSHPRQLCSGSATLRRSRVGSAGLSTL